MNHALPIPISGFGPKVSFFMIVMRREELPAPGDFSHAVFGGEPVHRRPQLLDRATGAASEAGGRFPDGGGRSGERGLVE